MPERAHPLTDLEPQAATAMTPLGAFALIVRAGHLERIHIGYESEQALRQRLLDVGIVSRSSDDLLPPFRLLLASLEDYLKGAPVDPAAIPIPLAVAGRTPLQLAIGTALRRIPRGSVTTYGRLAEQAKAPRAARAVGSAMATNPFPLVIPCHRVLGAAGDLRGFSAPGETEFKRRLLAMEGVTNPRQAVRALAGA